jgi:exodeoxyribonuclease VII large subunit
MSSSLLQPEREADIWTVSQLNRAARQALEAGFPMLWVEGEISNLARPASGHLYFSLKDSQSQVRCALFRPFRRNLGFEPENGMQVLVRARVTLYEGRGEFQLKVETMEPAGAGALQRAFEALKARLAKEGLFDETSRKPVPALSRRVGVVTSPSGAAIRDILTVMRRRFPATEVILYPVPVQGEGAAEKIAAMIDLADHRNEVDVLIVARGGGSLEDLWAFNEEIVARAIHRCRLPVVSGIGHEVDVTIADFVADLRAPTPSGAAEAVTPDASDLRRRLQQKHLGLRRTAEGALADARQAVRGLLHRLHLQHPGQRLRQQTQRVDELQLRLNRLMRQRLASDGERREQLARRLRAASPVRQLREGRTRLEPVRRRLLQAVREGIGRRRQSLQSAGRALHTVSPLATLDRGYAIVSAPDGRILRSVGDTRRGEMIEARLAQGRLRAEVTECIPATDKEETE